MDRFSVSASEHIVQLEIGVGLYEVIKVEYGATAFYEKILKDGLFNSCVTFATAFQSLGSDISVEAIQKEIIRKAYPNWPHAR